MNRVQLFRRTPLVRWTSLVRFLKGVGLVFMFLALLGIPSLARSAYFYRGHDGMSFIRVALDPGIRAAVSRPDHSSVRMPTLPGVSDVEPRDKTPGSLKGRVIIDRSHENALDDADLNVLVSSLTERGLQVVSDPNTEKSGQPTLAWPGLLRGASALIVISPHRSYAAGEVKAVERFVQQGGRVVLLGDPSRFALQPVDAPDPLTDVLGDILMPESDVAALNSLASVFGLAFADDYMYNTSENAGNYQYVILRDFASSPLTAGLEQVVFYAAHSIAADQETLISAGEQTTSSLSERRGELAAMSLGAEGQVLAVSDYTFMTEPYSTVADNSRLIANIIGYVAGAERTFGLSDLPYFFGDQTDLVYLADPAGDAALPAEVLAQVARLRLAFEVADKRLLWHGGPTASGLTTQDASTADGRDVLYAGSYAGLGRGSEAKDILASVGITFTLETAARARARPVRETTAQAGTPSATPDAAEPTPTPLPPRDWIHVPGIGPVDAKQTALFYQNEQNKGQAFIALTFDQQGLAELVERLLSGDYSDCLLEEDRAGDPGRIGLALCPATYQPQQEQEPASDTGGDSTPPPALEGARGGILIVSDDNGEGQYEEWTSAYDFADIATQAGRKITLWSTSVEGELDLDKLLSFDAVIWCTGDYLEQEGTPSAEDLSTLFAYLNTGGKLILSGAFIGPPDGERGLVVDIEVTQADHPLAEGFEGEEVIALERFTAEQDYVMTVLTEADTETIVFSRGPASELSGQAAITVETDPGTGSKTVWMGVPLYLLPAEVRVQLAGNAMDWVLE